ncbi:5,10-methylenetetrahydrofolate reductase, partial [Xanthomonas citri pv. citri]|nr:5,10-methylenetetrahydrofolate reductase [Xanthomonas citri pv. citri]
DESDRAGDERPFPYLETMDPAAFLAGPLSAWQGNAIVYRCVGKYEEQELAAFLDERAPGDATVFVGASSTDKPVSTTLPRAIEVHAEAE